MALLKSYSDRPNFSRLSKDVFIDVSLEFKVHPVTKDVTAKTGTAAIAQSLRNICLTNPGDLDEEPEFGVGVSKLLGENISIVDLLTWKDNIVNQCRRYEPRAEIVDVIIENEPGNYTVRIRLLYIPINVDTQEEVTITVTRVL